jgi:thioredoxin reductase (NADPH)
MAQPLLLKLYLDSRPVSTELEDYMTALASLTDRLNLEMTDRQSDSDMAPCVKVCLIDGTETGLAFHGVPGGHEFTSFVLGLYNAAGPGQVLDENIRREIAAIKKPVDIKVLVSLSCTMCPDTVIAAQRIAAENSFVSAQVYDIRHFQALKNRYQIMSVPCIIINDGNISFGKKNIRQMLDLIQQDNSTGFQSGK